MSRKKFFKNKSFVERGWKSRSMMLQDERRKNEEEEKLWNVKRLIMRFGILEMCSTAEEILRRFSVN